MAKKPAKSDRQAVVEQIRKQQRNADKRRGFMIVGVCTVIALLIVGAAAFRPIKDWWDVRQFNDTDLASIGSAASVCQKVTTKKATGQQQHVPIGTPIQYADAPPAFGEHFDTPAPMDRKLYTADDRPELGTLVHNLEHGYTILWYDETIAEDDDALTEVKAIASKFEDSQQFEDKFIAAPWTSEDGEAFPEGTHVALTHWSVGREGNGEAGEANGIWQYCEKPSGEVVADFMEDYPYTDSPEPNAA